MLPVSRFRKDASRKSGLRSRCIECQKVYWAEYYLKHSAVYKSRSKEWRINNRRQHAHNALMATYGISLDAYEELLAQQRGVCAICGLAETRNKKGVVYRLHVDHDHATGRIRALLCHHCNAGLGHFNDSVATMRLAIAYLRRRK